MNSFSKGFAPIILIIAALAVFVAGGLATYYGVTSYIADHQAAAPIEAQQTIQPTPTPSDQTADWKTYTNEKYGFEVKYSAIFSANTFEKGEGVEFDPIEYKDQPTAFSNIEIYTQGDNLPLNDWIKDPTHKKIVLGEYVAWQFNAQAASMDVYHTVIQSKSGELLDVVYRATANGDYQKEYNEMLNSFKFTK